MARLPTVLGAEISEDAKSVKCDEGRDPRDNEESAPSGGHDLAPTQGEQGGYRDYGWEHVPTLWLPVSSEHGQENL